MSGNLEKLNKDEINHNIVIKNNGESHLEKFIKYALALFNVIVSGVAAYGAFVAIPNVIRNSNVQEQTQVVVDPREGDIIVSDGGEIKLLQMINKSDITFPTSITEKQIDYKHSNVENRVDIDNYNNEDWSKRDSFKYTMNYISINSNKVINLINNLSLINIECDLYKEKDITTLFKPSNNRTFKFNFLNENNKNNLKLSLYNISSDYGNVTKSINDGAGWAIVTVEIIYTITEKSIHDFIISDWIKIEEDFIK